MASYKTNQQSCLLKFLKAHPREPMSVHEMYRRMWQEHPVQSIPGESTIYRLLRKFTEEGLVRKSVDTQSRESFYVYTSPPDQGEGLYMRCRVCGKLHYKANLTAYTEKLDALDSDFQTLVDGASVKTVVFGDRFPFRYFVDDYGLDYYAAFIGCSAETEASFETVAFLSQKVDELGVSTVFTIENSDQKIAKTIIENTKDKNQKILALNSLQSVSNEQIQGGMTYLGLMQENYDTLKEALS